MPIFSLCILQPLQRPSAAGAAEHYECTCKGGARYQGVEGQSADVLFGKHEDRHQGLPALPLQEQSDPHHGRQRVYGADSVGQRLPALASHRLGILSVFRAGIH